MNPSANEDGPTATGASQTGAEPEVPARAIDRRRLDEIFGDVLPESTRDDRDHPGESGGRGDSWFTENRPPHHGG
ncbi:hypothetical protein D1871_18565 [Nakamurella silvestris]|nr:hypothetical protein D1871_18565 [Nakamurella silvestris]